jgi:malate synthase
MTDKEFRKQKARVEVVWKKWAEALHLDHYYVSITWERKFEGDQKHWLASTQADWEYRQMFVYFYLPKIESMDDVQLDNLVLHEVAHMLNSPAKTSELDSAKLELATENVARAIEDAYKLGIAEGKDAIPKKTNKQKVVKQ